MRAYIVILLFGCASSPPPAATPVTSTGAGAQPGDPAAPPLETIPVADGIFMLVGQGGNIAVVTGKDGVFLVDDQLKPATAQVRAAVTAIDEKPIRFVLNTHWHGDHTGGNEALAGEGAIIVAHDNVRERMSTEQFIALFDRKVPPSPEAALPVVTFADAVTFHWNGETVRAFHVPHAHTDGDSVVRFTRANVVHTGDIYMNGFYPFIDLASGGSVDGVIAAVDRVLAEIDDQTKVIPGHGPLSDKAGLAAYRSMLAGARDRVRELVAAGKTLEEVQAAKPTAQWDAALGSSPFMPPARFVEILYTDAKR